MKKPCLVALFLVLLLGSADAQALKEFLSKGDRFFNKKDYANALANYLQAYELAPESAETNFKVGVSYLHGEKRSRALAFIEKAYAIQPTVDLDIEFHLGMAYQYDHQFDKARKYYEEFKRKNKRLSDIADQKIAECITGDSLSHHPAYVSIQSVGPIINSPFHEYSPLLSADGNLLIFTSNRSTDEYKIKSGTNYEDIYISRREGDTWIEPHKISPNINNKYHDAAASLSADGKTLFLYYEEGAGDIYVSTYQDTSWTKPVALNKNINSPLFWETSACISADGKKLYFTSNRPGGFGELDIYVSELDPSGDWGKAVNLGPQINTPYHEDSPFIHADGETLFFSSDGHPCLGSNDIFKSEFKNGKWSKPVNLGYPINSIDYDGFFILSADKKTGYYSAMREDGAGNADIYEIKFLDPPPKVVEEPPVMMASTSSAEALPPKEEPNAEVVEEPDFVDPIVALHKDMNIVTVLKGKVIDANSNSPLIAHITLVNNENNQVISRITSQTGTGDFELVIPHGGNYGVATEVAGYLFNSINFNLPQFAEYQEIDTHILMMKPEVGSKVVLKNIFFDVGKAEIKTESMHELEKIRELLTSNEQLKMQINGHTDNTGNASTNKILSLQRAEAVVKYLVENGIQPSRLSAKGFGAERPLVSNDDEQGGREINRRTEIEIIEDGHG
jgi:outer membrane protein OmpA-like peptidoglycan-associated protein/tetratricopeptide (TPR) repeat protein